MAQTKLQLRHSRRTLMLKVGVLAIGLSAGLIACAQATGTGQQRPVGLTLLFLNVGQDSIGVTRFDPDGFKGPTPGGLGAGGGGAQMTFMPGDSKRGLPQFVDVEWVVTTPAIKALQQSRNSNFELYKQPWMEETDRINSITPKYLRRVALNELLTPALLEALRVNPKSGNIKLTVKFNNDQVKIEAQPEQFR